MGLILTRPDRNACPEFGYAVVGESIKDPLSESLMDVWPGDEASEARRIAEFLQDKEGGNFNWYAIPVSFAEIVYVDEKEVKARYIEVSNLTHPVQKIAA